MICLASSEAVSAARVVRPSWSKVLYLIFLGGALNP